MASWSEPTGGLVEEVERQSGREAIDDPPVPRAVKVVTQCYVEIGKCAARRKI